MRAVHSCNSWLLLYFPVLIYSVRLIRKRYKGPKTPSSTFPIDDINYECTPCIFWFSLFLMTSNLELPIDAYGDFALKQQNQSSNKLVSQIRFSYVPMNRALGCRPMKGKSWIAVGGSTPNHDFKVKFVQKINLIYLICF